MPPTSDATSNPSSNPELSPSAETPSNEPAPIEPGSPEVALSARTWSARVADGTDFGRFGGPAHHIAGDPDAIVVRASFGALIHIRLGGDQTEVWLLDPDTGDSRAIATIRPALEQDVWAHASADLERIVMHASKRGADRGVMAIDVATGVVTQLVEPREFGPDTTRSVMLRSGTGQTLLSSWCDHEQCDLDLIRGDEVSALAAEFWPMAMTDRYAIGRVGTGDTYGVLDLETSAIRDLPSGVIDQLRLAVPVDGDQFLVDANQGGGRADIMAVDAAAASVNVLQSWDEPTMRAAGENLQNPVPNLLVMLPGAETSRFTEAILAGDSVGAFTADGDLVTDIFELAP